MQELGWDTYSQMTVTRTENNERKVGVAEAHALAEALYVPYDDLTRFGREAELHKMAKDFRFQQISLSGGLGVTLNLQEEMARHLDQVNDSVPAGSSESVKKVLDWSLLDFLINELSARLQERDQHLEYEPDDVGQRLDEVRHRVERQYSVLLDKSIEMDSGGRDNGIDQET